MRYETHRRIRWAIIVLIVIYAIYVVEEFARNARCIPLAVRIIHVAFWALGPPAWFFFEYWLVDTGRITPAEGEGKTEALSSLKNYADLAGKIWAAVLAVILLLYPKP